MLRHVPIDRVRVVNVNGAPKGGASVGADGGIRGLAPGKCKNVATTVMASILRNSIRSAITLPYAGGACAFTLQAPVGGLDPQVVGDLVRKLPDPNERPFSVEIDDFAGVPWFVASWTAGGGGMEGATPASGLVVGSSPHGHTGPARPSRATGRAGPTGRTAPTGPAGLTRR